MNPVLIIIGTRPEGIKMVPLFFALKKAGIPTLLCSTSQHTHLLDEVYQAFNFQPDIELHIMKNNQDLFHITQEVLQKTKKVFQDIQPQLVLVHGDTTTTMAASLTAFYMNIPVGHVEAGLRTHNMHNPFPEEMNRRYVSLTATYHFAPTRQAVKNLEQEKISASHIFYTGNTIVDALRIMREKITAKTVAINPIIQTCIEQARRNNQQIVLVTAHRRESFKGGIKSILSAIKKFALENNDIFFIYPYHPNPHIVQIIDSLELKTVHNLLLHEPLMYKDLVYVLEHADWVATDSGGIQEEAISLSKHVIVFREYTERPEGIWEGLATLVGTNYNKILHAFRLQKKNISQKSLTTKHIYGDGYAADKIVGIIQEIIVNQKKELHESYMHPGTGVHRTANSNSSSRI